MGCGASAQQYKAGQPEPLKSGKVAILIAPSPPPTYASPSAPTRPQQPHSAGRSLSLPKAVAAAGGIEAWNAKSTNLSKLLRIFDSMCQADTVSEALDEVRAIMSVGHHLWGYAYMRMLYNKNPHLYYGALLAQPALLLPVVYTPTVGEACQKFGKLPFFRRGCYICISDRGKIKKVLEEYANVELEKDAGGRPVCDCIVFSDGGRILGLGDLGTWGMGIPIGKLDLYTVCAGVNPYRTIPVILDAGCAGADGNTDKLLVRDHDLYTGVKQERSPSKCEEGGVANHAYYGESNMIQEFMQAAVDLFGKHCLLQFEDFNSNDAFPLLQEFRDKFVTYNDDIQGTAAVAAAGLLGAVRLSNPGCKDLREELSRRTFLFHGAGSANCGILQLLAKEAGVPKSQIFLTNSKGLIWKTEDGTGGTWRTELQKEYALVGQPSFNSADLVTIIREVCPSCIIGAVGRAPNCFTKAVIEALVEVNAPLRPVVFALSNPKTQAEVTSKAAYEWSNGAVVYGSGTAMESVNVDGQLRIPGQVNNVYIFPGMSMAVISCQARTIPDSFFMAAATAVANSLDDADMAADAVVPNRNRIREVSLNVATAVVLEAQRLGLAQRPLGFGWESVQAALRSAMWAPNTIQGVLKAAAPVLESSRRQLSLPKSVLAAGGVEAWNAQSSELTHLKRMLDNICTARTVSEALDQVKAITSLGHDLWAYAYMRMLYNKNRSLFYGALMAEPATMLPVVYTPTVGEACQKFGKMPFYRRGCYVSIADRGNFRQVLEDYAEAELDKDEFGRPVCDCIVFSDGGRILGLGDLAAWGMGIPVGKLDLYTVCAGVNPFRTMPVILDAGCAGPDGNTDKVVVRDHPLYTGLKQERDPPTFTEGGVGNSAYYGKANMIEEFMQAAVDTFGRHCLLQFEDFNSCDALPLLTEYRERFLTYNDDIQGTAAVAVAALLGAIRINNPGCTDLRAELSKRTFLFHGAGSANCGILQLLATEAGVPKSHVFLTNSQGLIWKSEDEIDGTYKTEVQREYALVGEPTFDTRDLVAIIRNLRPSVIIGAVGRAPGCFDQAVIEALVEVSAPNRPVVFALSNPKTQAEVDSRSAYEWSNGAVIYGSGTAMESVEVDGRMRMPGQVNNVYIFPGMSYGVIACQGHSIPESLFMAAAIAVANSLDASDLAADAVVPNRSRIREVSLNVATAVVLEAQRLGLAERPLRGSREAVRLSLERAMWAPGFAM